MERVRVWTESDEYVSLRHEALGLFNQSRQILYVITTFVIIAIGWYLTQVNPPNIPLWVFTMFLYGVLNVSAAVYIVNTNQSYRIGGYLAVFWESYDSDTRLAWHRLNRLGPAGGFLPNAATVVYGADMIAVLLFFLVGSQTRFGVPREPVASMLIWGIFQIMISTQLSRYLRYQRDRYEIAWREIKESPADLLRIHGRYETIPPRIIAP